MADRKTAKFIKTRLERINSNLPATLNWGIVLNEHSGYLHLHKGTMKGSEIVYQTHLISGKPKEIDYFLDGFVSAMYNLFEK